MRPADRFTYIKQSQIQSDALVLARCYTPIIGSQATALYNYFLAFYQPHQTLEFAHTLDHLDFEVADLQPAFEKLQAMNLIQAYQEEGRYQLRLLAPLSEEAFLEESYFRRLLASRIGDRRVKEMRPESLKGPATDVTISQVFGLTEEAQKVGTAQNRLFQEEAFKQRMAREGLRFENEATEMLLLMALAEERQLTWYEIFVLAKETAVAGVISTKRLQEQLQKGSAVEKQTFTGAEQAIIREAKQRKPIEFLASLKQRRRANITNAERNLLLEMAKMGLLDEVINVILLYTYNRVQSANLNEKYAMKVANDFRYQEIRSAEAAVLKINSSQKKPKKATNSGSGLAKKQTTNVPKWSKADYKNETSEAEREKLEAEKQRLLARLNQGGN